MKAVGKKRCVLINNQLCKKSDGRVILVMLRKWGIMETYKIEKGIPIESKQGKIKFTAECMRVGDSVLMESYPRAVSLANALRSLKKDTDF